MLGRARRGLTVVDALEHEHLQLVRVDQLSEARVGRLDLDEEDGGVEEEEKVDVGTVSEDAQFGVLVTEVEDRFRAVDRRRDALGVVGRIAVAQHRVEGKGVEEELGGDCMG